jgi:thioredoxin 1
MTFTTPIHTNEQSVDRVLGTGLPALLVFWRKECVPCQQLDAALNDLAASYAGKLLIAKIDAQDNPALVQRYGVTQLPELIFVESRAERARACGAASETALRSWLDSLLTGQAGVVAPSGPSIPISARSAPAGATTPNNGHGYATNGHVPSQPTREAGNVPITLTDATFDRLVGQSDKPVLVDFWAPWCGPCRAVAPTVERLAQEFAGRAVVAKLNVDENPRTAQRFGITGIPALFIFERGQVVERLVGAQPFAALRQALVRHVNNS